MCKGNDGKRSKVRGCKWRSCLQWQRHSPEIALAFDFGEEQSRDFVSGDTREEDFGLDNRREARLTR